MERYGQDYRANMADNASAPLYDSPNGSDKVAVVTTIVFALIEIVTNGGLLILLLNLWRRIGRYASFIQMCILFSIVVKSILDLSMRLPLFIMGSKNAPPRVCVALSLIPDYSMLAILVTLPLISAERLVKLSVQPTYSRKKIRHVFLAALITIYILGLVVALLPVSRIFATKHDYDEEAINSKCGGYLNYGYAFAYIYTSLTAISVLLVIVFSISTIVLLRHKLHDVETTVTKKSILKRGVISALTMTVVLFIATVPFALVLQMLLMCEATPDCTARLSIAFRCCIILQRLCFATLPIFFILLNKPLRKKLRHYIRRARHSDPVRSGGISTSTEKLSSDCTGNQEQVTACPRHNRERRQAPDSSSGITETSRV